MASTASGLDPLANSLTVCNVMAVGDIKMELDLREIAQHLHNARYNPRRFPAIQIRVTERAVATVLVFRTGKLLSTGARSEEDAKNSIKHIAKRIREAGFHCFLNIWIPFFSVNNRNTSQRPITIKLHDWKIGNVVGLFIMLFSSSVKSI